MKENFVCSICGKEVVEGFSNNAQPIIEGRCCEECNSRIVAPARVKAIMEQKRQQALLKELFEKRIERKTFESFAIAWGMVEMAEELEIIDANEAGDYLTIISKEKRALKQN